MTIFIFYQSAPMMKAWGKNKKVAEIKGEKVEKIREITKENGERLFGV